MVFFRCTVGGSGKGNTVTVTCAEEFAGLTITLSKTGKTYTKTCPSTSPYVVTYYGVENGTYTVSTTYGGQTYSETVIVQDISCVLNYGFTWRTWVDTASQLDSSDYDTLDEVLADEKALRELFLEHACVDYMASMGVSNEDLETVINNDLCAKWINLSDYALDYLHANEVIADLMDEADKYGYGEWALMPQVPTMTSDTAPYGVASASSVADAQTPAYSAFRGIATEGQKEVWSSSNNSVNGAWLCYQFVKAVCITSFMMRKRVSTYVNTSVKDFKLQASNDGSTWTDLGTYVKNDTDAEQTYDVENGTAYLYYRIYILTNWGGTNVSISMLQFYAWAPKGNVPVMTADSAPYGSIIISAQVSSYYKWYAFDNNESTNASFTNAVGGYIGYKFTNPVCVKKFHLYSDGNTNYGGIKFRLEASNDNTNYVTLLDDIDGSELISSSLFTISNSNYYLYYRIYQKNKTISDSGIRITTLQFYGRELKVSVPKMTSNTAPYGEASATNLYQSNAYEGFSGATGARFNSGSSEWELQYKFVSPIMLKKANYGLSVNSGTVTGTVKIQGSNNGTDWTDLTEAKSVSGPQGSFTYYNEDIETENLYLYLKAKYTKSSGSGTPFMLLQFYGLDYSEKEFEVGTTKKWLYDHGVELEPITIDDNNGASITKRGSDIYMSKSTANTIDGVYTTSKIDLSNYSLLRVRIGDEATYSNSRAGILEVMADAPHVYGGTSSLAALNIYGADIPNNLGLNVSSITQEAQPEISVVEATKCTIIEWWLE